MEKLSEVEEYFFLGCLFKFLIIFVYILGLINLDLGIIRMFFIFCRI